MQGTYSVRFQHSLNPQTPLAPDAINMDPLPPDWHIQQIQETEEEFQRQQSRRYRHGQLDCMLVGLWKYCGPQRQERTSDFLSSCRSRLTSVQQSWSAFLHCYLHHDWTHLDDFTRRRMNFIVYSEVLKLDPMSYLV